MSVNCNSHLYILSDIINHMNFDINIENDKNDFDIDYFFVIYKIIWLDDYYYEIDYVDENESIDDVISHNAIFWSITWWNEFEKIFYLKI